ncbi:MAG TPA: carboxypeptidase regulatory-like domain-containing protein, partial [Ktedonobacteraceae bacterium]|nr:carboxypeptidase regulatory-like domain-containing protein [Ktedonobacteraceae bacterium]
VLLQLQTPPPTRQVLVLPTPSFQPVVGDAHDPEDDDPDITVQQGIIPGFQFKQGGYTLSGTVVDARSGQAIANAVVWLDLPVQVGQPTSAALHTLTDAQGNYAFFRIAKGLYTVVASRYNIMGDGKYYDERVFSSIALNGDRAHVRLPLQAIAAPGQRTVGAHQARNLILIDVRGFYAASLLDDPALLDQTTNLRAFLQHANVASSVWWPYGWRPLDQYALLTGSYPQWATYDPWPHPVAWGMPDNVDTTYWFTGGRAAHLFGQASIFDVAKGYGMQTGVVAGSDFILSDATTRNLDILQRSSSFSASSWLAQIQAAVQAGQQNSNGFMLYGELPTLSVLDASSSPDAPGDDYQQALQLADQTFGQLLAWLGQQGMLSNTLIALTTSQAQANHTDADNFYGMGSTGQGSSKQTLLALSGPGVCPHTNHDANYSGFMIAPQLMQAMGLPAPGEACLSAPYNVGGCS